MKNVRVYLLDQDVRCIWKTKSGWEVWDYGEGEITVWDPRGNTALEYCNPDNMDTGL